MIAILLLALAASPDCWVRGDRADLDVRISRLDSAITTLGTDTVRVVASLAPNLQGSPNGTTRPMIGRPSMRGRL